MAAERLRAQLMQNQELFPALQGPRSDPRFGQISGIKVGTLFENRKQCYSKGLHTRLYAGISGTTTLGAFSVVLSGGYEDDDDRGNYFIYTGTGGKMDSFGGGDSPQSSDQSFDHPMNRSLQKSAETGIPVRVIRGPNPSSKYAPMSGYRYDGLYRVEKAYLDKGRSGHKVCKFEFRQEPDQPPVPVNEYGH